MSQPLGMIEMQDADRSDALSGAGAQSASQANLDMTAPVQDSILTSGIPDYLWLVCVAAIICSLLSLIVSLSLWLNQKRMKSRSTSRNYSPLLEAIPSDIVEQILTRPELPQSLSLEDQKKLWYLLRHVLDAHVHAEPFDEPAPMTLAAQQGRVKPQLVDSNHAQQFSSIPPQSDTAYPSFPTESPVQRQMQPAEVPAPVAHERPQMSAADFAKLSVTGREGMLSRGSRFDWINFGKAHTPDIFSLESNGDLLIQLGKKPTSQQWFFTLNDEESGLSCLFLGPAFLEKHDIIRSNRREYAQKFSRLFEIELRGEKPALIAAPVVRMLSGSLEVLEKGRLSL